jgi:hypothetical protein
MYSDGVVVGQKQHNEACIINSSRGIFRISDLGDTFKIQFKDLNCNLSVRGFG